MDLDCLPFSTPGDVPTIMEPLIGVMRTTPCFPVPLLTLLSPTFRQTNIQYQYCFSVSALQVPNHNLCMPLTWYKSTSLNFEDRRDLGHQVLSGDFVRRPKCSDSITHEQQYLMLLIC